MSPARLTNCESADLASSPALGLLRESWELASQLKQDLWQFAVEIDALRSAGLSNNGLRWLLARGFAQSADECTRRMDRSRRFRRLKSFVLTSRTCFVFTDEGYQWTRRIQVRERIPPSGEETETDHRPVWIAELRELRIDGRAIKRFTQSAQAQEAVLAAFQSAGWPPAIVNPLSNGPRQDPKRHLRYTVQNLNRAQRPLCIRFFINGDARTIHWEKRQGSQ